VRRQGVAGGRRGRQIGGIIVIVGVGRAGVGGMVPDKSHQEGGLIMGFGVTLCTGEGHFGSLRVSGVYGDGANAIGSRGPGVNAAHEPAHSIAPALTFWAVGTGAAGGDDGSWVSLGVVLVRLGDALGVEMGATIDFLAPVEDRQEGCEGGDDDDDGNDPGGQVPVVSLRMRVVGGSVDRVMWWWWISGWTGSG